jgi:hypothetical protein
MPLGENLINKGLITQEELDKALARQKNNPSERLGEILVKLGIVTKDQIESSL